MTLPYFTRKATTNTPRQLLVDKAIRLRVAGKTVAEIAESLGIESSEAGKLIRQGLAALRECATLEVEDARRLELERLDLLLASVWDFATGQGVVPGEEDHRENLKLAVVLIKRQGDITGTTIPTNTGGLHQHLHLHQGEQRKRMEEQVFAQLDTMPAGQFEALLELADKVVLQTPDREPGPLDGNGMVKGLIDVAVGEQARVKLAGAVGVPRTDQPIDLDEDPDD